MPTKTILENQLYIANWYAMILLGGNRCEKHVLLGESCEKILSNANYGGEWILYIWAI